MQTCCQSLPFRFAVNDIDSSYVASYTELKRYADPCCPLNALETNYASELRWVPHLEQA